MAGTTLGITKAESLVYDHRLYADTKDNLCGCLLGFAVWDCCLPTLNHIFLCLSVLFTYVTRFIFLFIHSLRSLNSNNFKGITDRLAYSV